MPLYNAGFVNFRVYNYIINNIWNNNNINIQFPEIQRIVGNKIYLDFECPIEQEIATRNLILGLLIAIEHNPEYADEMDNLNDNNQNDII